MSKGRAEFGKCERQRMARARRGSKFSNRGRFRGLQGGRTRLPEAGTIQSPVFLVGPVEPTPTKVAQCMESQ